MGHIGHRDLWLSLSSLSRISHFCLLITRAVLSPRNCAKPSKFRYVKPVGNFIRKISIDRENSHFGTTAKPFPRYSRILPLFTAFIAYLLWTFSVWNKTWLIDWSKIATPLYSAPPLRVKPSDLCNDHWWRKTRMLGLSDRERISMIRSAVLIQIVRVTDGRTDGIGVTYTRYSLYAVARKNLKLSYLSNVLWDNDDSWYFKNLKKYFTCCFTKTYVNMLLTTNSSINN